MHLFTTSVVCNDLFYCQPDTLASPIMTHRPLPRYAKLRVTHAPGMPGTFSPPPRVSYPDIHHGTCVTHVPWCMPESLSSGFLCRWRGKRSRRMRNPQFCVSGKRPMAPNCVTFTEYLRYGKYKHTQQKCVVFCHVRLLLILAYVTAVAWRYQKLL